MKFPITMLEFMHQFPDDDACRAYLEKMRWPNGFVCSRCQGTNASYVASRRLRQCATCRYQASVTAGTILHATQTSLQKWLLIGKSRPYGTIDSIRSRDMTRL